MTLDDLREALSLLRDLPGSTPVVLAQDGEGNGFSPLATLSPAMYAADSSFSGEWYMNEEQRAACDDPDGHSPAPDDAVPAVFLWPVN